MKVQTFELLPKETRILLSEEFRNYLFSNKEEVMKRLGISRNTVNAWMRGKYKPTIIQLDKLNVNYKNEILGLGLEGGRRMLLPPTKMDIKKLSWISGILDGDSAETRYGIGITNQDTLLVKTFIDFSVSVFGAKRKDFVIQVYSGTSQFNHEIKDLLKISKDNIRNYKSKLKLNAPVIKAILYSTIIAKVMKKFKHEFLSVSNLKYPAEVAWYVRGLADSDGGFVRNNICIQQKYPKGLRNLEITKKILDENKILNGGIKGPHSKNLLRIYIFSDKHNLGKYYSRIGFYSPKKLEKLKELIT